MDPSPGAPMEAQMPDPLTFGDLCYAIEKGRLDVERRGSSFEVRIHEVRRWGRQEIAFRAMLEPLSGCLSLDLGGFA
ncbi:MAG TPA: hypothetical protein VF808_09060 [Ktedonobacterales bacterium]